MPAPEAIPLRDHFQLRLLLKSLERARKITKKDSAKILETLAGAGAKFSEYTIAERQELERGLSAMLLEREAETAQARAWRLRSRHARGHDLARACILLDCYADDTPRADTVRLVHAFLVALAEKP